MGIFFDAISGATMSLWAVGSFIIFSSALIAILRHLGVFFFLAQLFAPIFSLLGLPAAMIAPLLEGTMEMTNGCYAVSSALIPMSYKVIGCSFLVSFGGISVLGQSLHALRHTGIHPLYLLGMKGMQGILALCFSSLLVGILPLSQSAMTGDLGFIQVLGANTALLIIGIVILSILGVFLALYNASGYWQQEREQKVERTADGGA